MWPFKKKATVEATVATPVVAPVAAPVEVKSEVVEFDINRLNAQTKKVYNVIKNGKWITLPELAKKTGSPEASVSARLRDLRKPQFGALTVERRRNKAQGLYEYRLVSA